MLSVILRFRRFICTLLCFGVFVVSHGQNVTKVEWFVDADPGFGAGTPVTFTPGQDVDVNFQFDISPFANGFHNLYVRSYAAPYQVVEDGTPITKGGWSLTHTRQFYKEDFTALNGTLPNVTGGEYFIDADPGFGSGQPIALSPGTDVSNVAFSFDVTSLTAGFHNLYVRFRDAQGRWSHASVRNFYKEELGGGPTVLSNVVAGEYFVDTDPGFGSGAAIPVVAGSDINNLSFTLDVTSLTPGFHNLYVRFKNANGSWSHCSVRNFYKEDLSGASNVLPNVVAGEYFIDADPGHGAGVPVPVSASANITNLSFTADVTNVSTGFHTLSVRFRNADGRWSHAHHRSFYKEDLSAVSQTRPNLVSLEYFVDTDPGFGNGTSVPLNPTTDLSSFSFPIDMTTVSIGNHRIYVRALDASGHWSLVHSGAFVVQPPAAIYITIGGIANAACAGAAFNIPFTVNMPYGSNNVFTAQLSDANGNFAYPTNIGTLTGRNSDTIRATIPAGTYAGVGYRVRILASSPLDTSAASGSSFTVRRVPEDYFSIIGKTAVCKGTEPYALSATQPNTTYTWNLSGGGTLNTSASPVTVAWTGAGNFSLSVTPSNSCGNGPVRTLNVTAFDTLPLTAPVITANNRNLYASAAPQNTANGYQWYRNDTLLAGAVGSYLYANIDGVYKVAFSNTCGLGPKSTPVTVSTLQTQTVSFDSIPAKVFGDAPFALNATASSGLPVTFAVISGPASVSGNVVTLHGVGTVVIRATQAGNATYASAFADRSFAVAAPPAPDLTVQNVSAVPVLIAPGDSVTLSWTVKNIGAASSPTNWTERLYMQSPDGSNRTLLRQMNYANAGSLDTAQSVSRSAAVAIPPQFNIGDNGVFAVELIPGTGVQEVAGGGANNTGVQPTPWAVKKLLKLLPSVAQLTEGGSSLSFSVSRTGSLVAALPLMLVLRQPQRFSAPTTVSIPAGQASVSFNVSLLDNLAIEGTLRDTLSVSAAGFDAVAAPLVLLDNDNPALTLTNLPASAMEGDTVRFKVTTNLTPTAPLTVYLNSTNPTRFPVPASVVIAAGATTADVAVVLQQDLLPEIDLSVTVTAGAAGHQPGTGSISVKDDDIPNLQLVIATHLVSEGAGPNATTATLRRLDTANHIAFTANLSANLPSNLILPASISLGANENQKTFTIGTVENTLAEGQRTVTVTASLYVSTCGCSAPPTSSGFVSDTLVVSDNDGPALTVAAPQLALPEGGTFPAALRISRNTPTTTPLSVSLVSSDTTEAKVPATVTIPAGQSYVDVAVSTVADGITDGSQQVYFTVTSAGFAGGSVWVMVTDLNKPDLTLPSATVGSSAVQALGIFNYNVSVRNTGFATAPAGVVLHGYLSKDSVLDATDSLLTVDTLRIPVPVGQTVQLPNAVAAPDRPGQHYLLFKVNADLNLAELLVTNNTSRPVALAINPAYTATAAVALTHFKKGTPVPVTGSASNTNGTPAANKPVEVYVITNGLRRTVAANTDANGFYATHFTPLAGEAGRYTVGASFPGLNATAAQDSFDILGVKVNNGAIPQFKVVLNDTLRGTLPVENLSGKALSSFSLAPETLPTGAKLIFDTLPNLPPFSTANIGYKAVGNAVSGGNNFLVASLQAVSTDGAVQPVDAFYYCQAPNGYLAADLTAINVTVSQSAAQKLVEVRVVNKGIGASGAVTLSLPQVPWLSSVTPTSLPSLSPGDTAVVVLKFIAHPSVPFNYAITGSIGINAQNGNSFSLPFTFTKTSETAGVVKAVVTNQFTYYTTGAPKVAGALVKIKNYFTGVLYAQGLTDSAGVFTAAGVPEGRHRITVEKDKHLPYEGTVTIVPGDTVRPVLFINYQAITFSWNVVPTAIQDQYDITLTTQFETHVPVPVVTIDMPKRMPALSGHEKYPFNVTLTNHGLITAKDVALNLPTGDPEYEFVTNYQPADLLAQQSIQVPVIMRRRGDTSGTRAAGFNVATVSQFLGMSQSSYSNLRTQSSNCQDFTGVVYWYKCNLSTGSWERGGVLFTYDGRACAGGPGGGGGGGGGGGIGGGGGGIGGGGGFPPCAICPPPPTGGSGGTPEVKDEKKNCVDCLKDLYDALKECIPVDIPPVIDCGVNTVLNNGGAMDYAQCLLESQLPPTSIDGVLSAISDAVLDKLKDKIPYLKQLLCIKAVLDALKTCLESTEGSRLNTSAANARTAGGNTALLQTFANKLGTVARADSLRVKWITEYFGDLPDAGSWPRLYALLQARMQNYDTISNGRRDSVVTLMTNYDITPAAIQNFVAKWNRSVKARAAGVLSSTAQYPDIINWANIKRWSDSLVAAHNYAVNNGYASLEAMHTQSRAELDTFLQQQKNAVCAAVTVKFSQRLTMTREAFAGTLEIFNGHPTDKMDSLSVVVQITDAAGVPSNGLFEIQTTSLTGLANVTGTGQINAQQKGTVKFLFIPEVGAAPTVPKDYNFGGYVRYWDPYVKAIVTMPLSAVTLTVNPSPNLMLHYFMQRNILGDDPLTSPDIEPSVPAQLAVMVENHGYGPAVNMVISSAQPEIVDNEKGLAINFNLIGSSLQGKPTNFGLLDVNFGTVPPLQTRTGQWLFTSSLLGKFVKYEAQVVHANSFGNPELSLVKGIEIHELTKSIRAYQAGEDTLDDFLVNGIFDINDQPDIIYFSQGKRTERVYGATGSFSAPVSPPGFTNVLTVSPSDTGWNYVKLPDPGNRRYELVSVTRSDGQAIPLNNAWLTFVTLPVSQPPVYENKFHFVDSFRSTAPVTYTVVWKPRRFDVPKILRIEGVPDTVTTAQVQKLRVVFDKAIDSTTFTNADFTLTFQGGPNLINSSVVVRRVDTSSFDVDLSAITTGNGFYNFTVQAADVTDVYGINGLLGKSATWSQFLNVPAVQAFQGLPASGVAASYDKLRVLFNLPLDASTVTPARFTMSKNGVAQAGSVTIDSIGSGGKLVYLSGLGALMGSGSGDYVLTVDVPGIKSAAGVLGLKTQSVTLKLDNAGPVVVSLTKQSGGIDAQHVPFVRIQFDEDAVGFNVASLELRRNGVLIPLNIAQLSNQGLSLWMAGDFGLATYPDGNYTFTVNLSTVKDAAGNFGTGTAQVAWTVNRAALITVSNLSVTPDRGYSDSDGVSSGLSLTANFTLSSAASQVTLAQTDAGGETVLASLTNLGAGNHSVPLTLATGGNTGLKVTAIGINGGSSWAQLPLFIDPVPLTAQWLTPAAQVRLLQMDSAVFEVSDKLLTDTVVRQALSFSRNGFALPTANLSVQKMNDSVYAVKGLRSPTDSVGTFALRLNTALLSKYNSGRVGENEAVLSWTVKASNRIPVARAGRDTLLTATGTYVLNATASTDADGDSLRYKWVAPAGIMLSDSTSATPSFTVAFPLHGRTLSFLLIASDGIDFNTDAVAVQVRLFSCRPEVCNGVDDDCDGLVDEEEPVVFYRDADGDGFGTALDSLVASNCTVPQGYATRGGDCDDADASVYPGSGGNGCGACAGEAVAFAARVNNGRLYQWQVDNGSGFQNLSESGVYSGTTAPYLLLNHPPTSLRGFKFRCAVTNDTGTVYSPVYELRFRTVWSGDLDTDWLNAANWTCGLPDEFVDAVIPGGRPYQPTVSAAVKAYSLKAETGAVVNVKTGAVVEVKGKQ